MNNVKNIINKLTHNRKISFGLIVICLAIMASILIPTLANFIDENATLNAVSWDGSISSGYKSGNGSKENPYVISNGAELAYFGFKLEETDYSETYFTISNNIFLNKGSLRYNPETGIEYLLNGNIYYVEYYTNKYFDNVEKNGNEIGTVNILNSFNNFAGHIEGNLHTIYGMYVTDSSKQNLALFNSLEGNVKNLFFKNSLIYGGSLTAGLAVDGKDLNVENVIFDGYVIGSNGTFSKTFTGNLNNTDINVYNYETLNYIDIASHVPAINGTITSVRLKGEYQISGENASATINGSVLNNNVISINLGTEIPQSVEIKTSTTSYLPVTLSITNLTYEITYDTSITAGLFGKTENTTITNSVNIADIYGNKISSGLVGLAGNNTKIIQSYNRGTINSKTLSSGLVGIIESTDKEVKISSSYNSGKILSNVNAGLIGEISSSSVNVTIEKSFEGTEILPIGSQSSTGINIVNSFVTVASYVNGFINSTTNEIKNEQFLTNNLELNKYISDQDYFSNSQNIWSFGQGQYPYNYYDSVLEKTVRLQTGNLVYKSYNNSLENKIIKSKITFNIEEVNALDSILSKEIFISNSNNVLSQAELVNHTDWTPYNGIQQITEEGSYIIYTKIADYKNNVRYVNTDILVLDLTEPEVSINSADKIWNNFDSSRETIYSNKEQELYITATDNLSGIAYIKYLIAEQDYSLEELADIDENDWQNYKEKIVLNEMGTHIVYAKVIDNSDNTIYLNTDYYNYQGYSIKNAYAGYFNSSAYQGLPLNITSKSVFSIQIDYQEEIAKISEDLKHNIVSSILLPKDTVLKLIDNINSRVYSYQIPSDSDDYGFASSCLIENIDCENKATYPFTLFKENGKSTSQHYTESNYYTNGKYNESFTLIADFSKTNILTNYENIKLFVEKTNDTNIVIKSTIENSIKKFNLYSNINSDNSSANIYLTTDYSNNPINLHTNSITEINLTSGINYKRYDDFKIIDTTYEYGSLGFEIKLVDMFGNKILKDNLKNIAFQVDSKNYFLGEDSTVRVFGNSLQSELQKVLKIITYEGDSGLAEGTYYFKITAYKSLGSYFAVGSSVSEVTIPVNVSKINYSKNYDLEQISSSSIISKNKELESMNFSLKQNGELSNKSVRVSLYEKAELTAYDQKYNLIDLKNYITDNLTHISNYSYSVTTGENFILNFDPVKFNSNGYQLIFEVYDGNTRVDTIKKYFIVR